MRIQKGFSLIELMVVVAIIGILASIAVPSYNRSVAKSARGEGMTEILDIMRAQENFFANAFTYTTDLTDLNFVSPHITSNGRYSIAASACAGLALTQCVQLTATPLAGQVIDGNLILDSRGTRSHNGNAGWIR
ncbi:MAG: type IV pilus assembly protein PilE [Psychrobacter glaciei]|jgi:type IV pilus assembly protein PilE